MFACSFRCILLSSCSVTGTRRDEYEQGDGTREIRLAIMGALMIGIGFWGMPYYNHRRSPQTNICMYFGHLGPYIKRMPSSMKARPTLRDSFRWVVYRWVPPYKAHLRLV